MSPDADQPEPSLTWLWLRANLIAAVVNAVASLAVFGLNRVTEVGAATTRPLTAGIVFVVAVAVQTSAMALFGRLTADVLVRTIPLLPQRAWIALHLLLGLGMSVAAELNEIYPDPSSSGGLDEDLLNLGMLVLVAVVVAAIGAAIGVLEALILRRAAYGMGAWIGWSALSGLSLLLYIPIAIYEPQPGLQHELASVGATIVIWGLTAVMLLPAVRRLRAKTIAV